MAAFVPPFLSSPLLKTIAYTLSFTVIVTSCMINPTFQTSGPRAEQMLGRGGLPSSLFRKITQQYILLLEYANSTNFLFFEAISELEDLSKNDDSVNLFRALEGKSVSWLLARVTHWKQGCNGNWPHAFCLCFTMP